MTTLSTAKTRRLLLAAAREEFAAYGIAGARVDRIAARADVSKERIYGHFGSKERLFDEVVVQALDELAAAVPLDGDPAEYVGLVYDFHRDHPHLLRLFLWEALHYREGQLPNEGGRARRYQEKVEALAKILGTEPSQQVSAYLLTLIGLAAWPLAVPQLARLILDASGDPAPLPMRDHVVAFARQALAGVSPRTGGDAATADGEPQVVGDSDPLTSLRR